MVIVVVTFSWTLPTNSPINPVVHQPSAATKRQVKVPFQLNPWEWTKLPAAIKQQWVCHCWLELLTGWVYLQISRLGILNFTTHSLFIWKLGFRAKVRLKGVCFKTPKVVARTPQINSKALQVKQSQEVRLSKELKVDPPRFVQSYCCWKKSKVHQLRLVACWLIPLFPMFDAFQVVQDFRNKNSMFLCFKEL